MKKNVEKAQKKSNASRKNNVDTSASNPPPQNSSGISTRSRLNSAKAAENSPKNLPKSLPRGRPRGSIGGIGSVESRQATTRAEIEAGLQRTLQPLQLSYDEGGSHVFRAPSSKTADQSDSIISNLKELCSSTLSLSRKATEEAVATENNINKAGNHRLSTWKRGTGRRLPNRPVDNDSDVNRVINDNREIFSPCLTIPSSFSVSDRREISIIATDKVSTEIINGR